MYKRQGENIRAAGLEARAGDVVMAAGEVVTPAGAGLLANAGHAFVPVPVSYTHLFRRYGSGR